MRSGFMLATAALLMSACMARAEPLVYQLDLSHSEIEFSWDHLGLSKQHGAFETFETDIAIDWNAPELSHVNATIAATSIDTGWAELDEQLQQADWFDTALHPEITFHSTRVVRTGQNTGAVEGDLTIRGITRPVSLRLEVVYHGEHPFAGERPAYVGREQVGLVARGHVLRSDFGMVKSRPWVSDDIEIEITVELTRRPPAA